MDQKKINIALIGECMTEFNGTLFGNMKHYFGGDTLNAAVYLSRLNNNEKYQVNYISAVGADKLSNYMLKAWNNEGVNTENVLIDSVRSVGAYLIQLDEFGERSFQYWRDNSAAKYMVSHENFQKVASSLENMDVIYLSGISLAILPVDDCACLISLLIRLSKQGKQIVFDTNHRPKLWESNGGESRAQDIYSQIFAISELALLTDDDEMQLWGDKDADAILKRLKKTGLRNVVLKQGKDGCIYQSFIHEDFAVVGIEKSVQVVDTTSAGDSFNAGYLSGYLRGLSPRTCAQIGNQVAGVVIQHKGALIDKAHLNDVIERMNQYE